MASAPGVASITLSRSPDSVRTPVVGSLCPVCRRVPLKGRQTVCSAACRRRRSRQREAEARTLREHAERATLEAIAAFVQARLRELGPA
jgi:hypothetical protein